HSQTRCRVRTIESEFVRTAGPTAAWNRALADRSVIVGELFTRADRSGRANPDRLVDHLEVAVRRARVVDETRDVAADARVAAPRSVHAKYPQFTAPLVCVLARLAVRAVANQLASIVDDASVLANRFGGEHTV